MICGGDGRVHGRTWQYGRRAWSGNAPPPPNHPLHVPIHILLCLLRSSSLSSSRHHLPRRHVHIHTHHHHIRSPPLRHHTCPNFPLIIAVSSSPPHTCPLGPRRRSHPPSLPPDIMHPSYSRAPPSPRVHPAISHPAMPHSKHSILLDLGELLLAGTVGVAFHRAHDLRQEELVIMFSLSLHI